VQPRGEKSFNLSNRRLGQRCETLQLSVKVNPLDIGDQGVIDIQLGDNGPRDVSATPVDAFNFEFLHHPSPGQIFRIFNRVGIHDFMYSVSDRDQKVCCHWN